MKSIEELEVRLNTLVNQMNVLEEEQLFGTLGLTEAEFNETLGYLRTRYFEIVDELDKLKKADYSDGEIDLLVNKKKSYEERDVYYDIRLSDSRDYIGEIRVTFVNPISFSGDIGYELKPEFRGNGYMIKALNVLKEPLRERGLVRPKLTVYPNNKASVRTIEKFGGKKIDTNGFYDTYQVDLEDDIKRVK